MNLGLLKKCHLEMIKKISFKVNVDDTNATIQKVTVNGQGDDDVNGFTKRLFNRF